MNKRVLICLIRNAMKRRSVVMDYEPDNHPENWRTIKGAKVHLNGEGQIDGGAGGKFSGRAWTSETHPHKGSSGSNTASKLSYKEKMLERAKMHREKAEKAQAEAERAWAKHGEMASETIPGQPVISKSYGSYRNSMQREFEKSREAHNKAEYHQRKAESIEKRFKSPDIDKVRSEIKQRETYKVAMAKASKAIKAGNREDAISEVAKVNPTMGKYLEKQSTGTVKNMINGFKTTNSAELKKLKKQEENAMKEG